MILIITHKEDYTADFLINKLNQRNIAYKRFNCEDILSYEWSVAYNDNTIIRLMGDQKFNSVWFRRTQLPDFKSLPINERIYLQLEIDSFLSNMFSVMDAKWLSPPSAVSQAEHKLLQLKVAQKMGFRIPETLITNSKNEVESFFYQHNEDIIVKPIGQTRIMEKDGPAFLFTNMVSKKQIDNLNQFDLTPVIFQNNIKKELEIRVTVVGNKVFSAFVDSQSDEETKIDWRKKKLQFSKFQLPEEIEEKCIRLVAELHLYFGAIDIIKGVDGQYVFLEINPNGQWAWIESQTGLRIADEIINHLSA